jgi:hypothetical protein
MGKSGCKCGHIIVDQTDNLEYKGYILPDTYVDNVSVNLTMEMKAILEKFGGRGLPHYSRVYDEPFHQAVSDMEPLDQDTITTLKTWLELPEELEHCPLKYLAVDVLSNCKHPPKSIYPTVFLAGLKHRDPSMNRYFFYLAKRLKGEEQFFNDIVALIQGDDDYFKIEAISSIYWSFPAFHTFAKRRSAPYFLLDNYRKTRSEIKQLLHAVMDAFLQSDNPLVLYELSQYLPRHWMMYPFPLVLKAWKVQKKIKEESLPETPDPNDEVFIRIWKMAREDEALGHLFFDQLKARPRDLDPDMELQTFREFQKKHTFHRGMWKPKQ